jgi:hypothetical protein
VVVPSHATLVVVGRPTIVVTGVQSSGSFQQFVVGVPLVARALAGSAAPSLYFAREGGPDRLRGRCRWWKATDAPSHGTGMGRFGPQTAIGLVLQ